MPAQPNANMVSAPSGAATARPRGPVGGHDHPRLSQQSKHAAEVFADRSLAAASTTCT
jgi:hypothetical protein